MTEWTEAASKLAAQVTATAPEWHEAVCATPRHVLVPRWWETIPDTYPFAWELVTPDGKEPWAKTYADVTLVTRVGASHADQAQPGDRPHGLPTSSSTLPGLIVRMLHLLDPKPGQRTLDAGTGSGYSAALLGQRFGDDCVTSIDVDPDLVEAARERLAGFGRIPRIEVADATGALPDSEYDRIMATVSVRPIPRTWLDSLPPGGRIVTTIIGTSLLISADMRQGGVAYGRIQPDPASFMRTRQDTDYPARLDGLYATGRDQAGEHVRKLTGPIPDLWSDWSLRCLYELDSPDIEYRSATMDDGSHIAWLLSPEGSWARAEQASGTVHQNGPQRLWDDLERVQTRWEEAGRFPLHHMRVELGPDRSVLVSPDGAWNLTL